MGCGWVQTAIVQANPLDDKSCTKPIPDRNGICLPSTPPPCPDPNAFACGAGSGMVFFVAPTVDGSDGTRVLTLGSAYACLEPTGFVGCSIEFTGGGSTTGGSDTTGASSSTGNAGGTGPGPSTTDAPTSGGTASYDTSTGGDTNGGSPPTTDICTCLCGVG